MNEIPKLPSAIEGLGAARSAGPTSPARTGGPAFEALLERLSARAADLGEKSRTLSGPEELPQALDAARSSLEEALALGEELLEAYRASQRNAEPRP
jgi:hypothetical protein